MKNDTRVQGSQELNSVASAQQSQRPSVAAIEFMTFHHEVLAAFCKHAVELNIRTLVVSPSRGIQKAIKRFAADSFTRLTDLAHVHKTEFNLAISHSAKETALRITEADALFIGTIPPRSSSGSSQTRQIKASSSRHEEMILTTRAALKRNKPVYVVIHKPQEDAAQLVMSLEADECKRISAIYLSRDTAKYCQQHFPSQFHSELIMPAIGLLDSTTGNNAESKPGISMVIAGEVSSKRRRYESLSCLYSNLQWLRAQNVTIRIIGRIKLESWLEKVLRLCALPASYLFLVKYPMLLPLWRSGHLDLSMTRYSKVSDQTLANAITDSACLLDLKRQHYSAYGQTTGALGLAMTHEKPLISLETIKALILDNHQLSNQSSLNELVEKATENLIAEKKSLIAKFREQLLKELLSATSTQDLTTI